MTALLALAAGCRLAPAEEQGRPPIATSLVDENYRIQLDRPGQGWQLLENHDAGTWASNPGLCAYDEEQSLSGCVTVALAPPATLHTYVTDWLNRIDSLNRSTIIRERSEFLQQPSEFFEAEGTYSREPTRVTGVVFYYQAHVYRVLVRGPSDKFDRTRSKRFLASIRLLPGKVHEPREERQGLPEVGFGYRVASGLYENAIKGFKISLESGWRVVAGSALREFDPDADVVLVRENPDISTTIRVESGRDDSALTALQENHRRVFEVELLDERAALNVNGAKSRARVGRAGNGNMVAYCTFSRDGRSMALTAAFAELYRAESLRLIEQVANSISIVPDANRAKFEESFGEDALHEYRVGDDYVLTRGCYRDFSLGFAWCHPQGFWSFNVDEEARINHDGLILRAKNLNTNVTLDLTLSSRSHAEPSFESIAKEHGLEPNPTARVGSFTRVAAPKRGARRRVSPAFLYSLAREADELTALVTCNGTDLNCGRASEALANAVVVKDFGRAVEFTDDGLVDRRLGIQQRLPKSFHARSREELPMKGGQRATWESPDISVTLLSAVDGFASPSSPGMSEMIDRITRATVPIALLRQSRSTTLTVLGEQADCQSFVGLNYRFDIVSLRHGRVLLALLVGSRSQEKLQQVLSGLRSLDDS